MRTVALVLHDDARIFDYAVVAEVFDREPFTLRRYGAAGRPVRMRGQVTIRPDAGLAALPGADLVIVPGTDAPDAPVPPALARALRAAHAAGRPIAALCAGAFTLAGSGLLDGRRATTHWALTDRLAARYPAVTVVNGPLWIEDGPLWTSAGTAAGIDLCLHLIRRAHGAALAARVARAMVTPPHRDGGQLQYVPRAVPPEPAALGEVLAWARAHLDRPLTVAALARRAHQSPRTFARRFADATGTTPLRWLHHQRVQLAQELLEGTGLPVEQVARRTGFGTTAVLRRHFGRALGTTPTAYRRRFAA
jgi:transcriptional regulator GlxA family with amidase domain